MKIKILRFEFFVVIFALLCGCAHQPTIQPTATGTLFTIPHQPFLKVEINHSLQYLGEIERTHSSTNLIYEYATATGCMVSSKGYRFVKKNSRGVVKRGCEIWILELHERLVYWKPDQFEHLRFKLEKGRETILNTEHNYVIYLTSFYNDEHLKELNLKGSQLYLAKTYADVFNNNRSLLLVGYYEDIYTEDNLYKDPREWVPVEEHSKSQRMMVEEFKERAASDIRFLPTTKSKK